MSSPEFDIPDFFDPSDWSTPQDDNVYRKRPIGEWMEAQLDQGQLVIPKVSRPVPIADSEHMVMWAERRDVDSLCTVCHQILCDCVMDMPISDVSQGRFTCKAVTEFIKWGAKEVRRARNLDVIMGFYGNIAAAEPVKEDRKERPGDQVLQTLITDLVSETQKNPGNWVGNKVSGSHSVEGIAYVFGQEPRQTLRILEGMQQDQVIELVDDQTVRLRAA